jgi:site-specific DNA-methyltransferase (adenine-specific)
MKTWNDKKDIIKHDNKQMRSVWSIANTPSSEKKEGKHPTQKPIELLTRIILSASNENDVVLDPFCGSGTTGVVSKKYNRNFIGIDNCAEYIELTKKRLEKTNGK